jgi:hypothetical protein
MTCGERKKEETGKSEVRSPMSSGISEMMRKHCGGEGASSHCAAVPIGTGGLPCCGTAAGKTEPEGGNNEGTE